MHDMGYLSQIGNATQSIRDHDGVVLPTFQNYVQKIRTPALKGLRFNRLVTDAHRNTKRAGDPACDFLLHDGRACDAITAIQTWVLADPVGRESPQTRKMVSDFSKKGKCESDTTKGVEHVPKSPDDVMLVKVQINDTGGMFIVDTGATFVSLTRDFAKRAKVDITGTDTVSLQTANGQITADLGIANSVKLGHAQARKVPIVVQESSLGKGVDGLLGMSFLARFNVTVTDKELQLKAMNAP